MLAPSAAAARGRRNGLPVRAVKTEASQPYGEHASKFSSMERHVQTELIAFLFSPLTVYTRCFPRSLLINVLRTWLLRPAGLPFLFHSATLRCYRRPSADSGGAGGGSAKSTDSVSGSYAQARSGVGDHGVRIASLIQ